MGFRNRLNFPPGSITAAMLADGSVTGAKLTFDAIDGKTITGAKIRTAAPPALRWELTSDAVNLLRAYSGHPSEDAPGGVFVGTGGSPGSVQLLAPAFGGVAPASILLNQVDAGGSSEVTISSRAGGGTLEDSANPANNISWLNGDLTVPGAVIATDAIFSQAYSGTTDASGFLPVTHTAGFTPTGGWAVTGNPNGSFAQFWGIDQLAATSVRLRFTSTAAVGNLANTAVAGRLFLVRP